jgi:hypothetical protein
MYDYDVWTVDGRNYFVLLYEHNYLNSSYGPLTHDKADRFGWTWLKAIKHGSKRALRLLKK